LRHTPRFTRATETATLPRLAVRQNDNQDAFRRVAIGQVVHLVYEQRWLPWLGSVAPPSHRFRLETAAECVSPSYGVFLGQLRPAG